MTQEFKDHIVQHPNRFKRVPVAGTTDQFDLIPTWVENPSEVVQLGTPIDRQLFEGITSQLAEKASRSELNAVNNELTQEVNLARTEMIDNTRIAGLSVQQIDKNKGKFDQTYMTDEFLQQMAGNTPINATPADYSLTKEKFAFPVVEGTMSKNLFDKTNITVDKYINGDTGQLFDVPEFFVSAYIPVSALTDYSIQPQAELARVAFYTSAKAFISYVDNAITFKTPANTAFVRLSYNINTIDSVQFEQGSAPTNYVEYSVKLTESDILFGEQYDIKQKRLYTLNDAYTAWFNGSKFPIAYFGDSTTDALGTTGWNENVVGTDHQPPNAYTSKLQSKIRDLTNNNMMRIYNAGFSGQTAQWALANINAIFGSGTPYANTKMVGISFGINDRLLYQNIRDYRVGFKSNIKSLIEWFYARDIQPFLLTTQASVEAGVEAQYASAYPLRTSESIAAVANEVKRELAEEYGLELIDVNAYTEKFLKYSSYSLQTIIADKLHFGDVGHEYEAGLMFAHIVPRTIMVSGVDKLGFADQRLYSVIPSDLTTYTTNDPDGFKAVASYTKSDSVDLKIAEFWIFVDTDRQLSLAAYKSDATSLTYVKVDGVTTTLDALSKSIGNLDLGLHRLEVFTGLSNKVDFKGFKLT